jgi:hypothetical protein
MVQQLQSFCRLRYWALLTCAFGQLITAFAGGVKKADRYSAWSAADEDRKQVETGGAD